MPWLTWRFVFGRNKSNSNNTAAAAGQNAAAAAAAGQNLTWHKIIDA